jgi:anti-sigma factor RsiW
MNCTECQQALIDYAHNEVQEGERQAIAVHLADCPSCALEYCRLQAAIEGFVAAHSESPRPEVRAELRRSVERAFAVPWWRRVLRTCARPIPAYSAAAFAVVPLLVWLAGARWMADGGAADRLPSNFISAPDRAPGSRPVTDSYDGSTSLRTADVL